MQQSLYECFAAMCLSLQSEQPILVSNRTRLDEEIGKMDSDIAKLLYIDLCRVQIAAHNNTSVHNLTLLDGLLDWSSAETVRKFHSAFIDNGQLVDKIADSIEMTRQERFRKWTSQKELEESSACNQRELSRRQKEWSTFMYNSRDMNRKAYEEVRAILMQDPPKRHREWHSVILESAEQLERKNMPFWWGLQTGALSTVEKRAVCHKLALCMGSSGMIIQERFVNLMADLFAAQHSHPVHRRYRLSFFRRVLKHLFRKQVGTAQADKNRRVPVLPQSA